MTDPLAQLTDRLREIQDLQAAGAVLHWDQATYMPPGGGAARGRQLATLSQVAHEKLTDPAIGLPQAIEIIKKQNAAIASVPEVAGVVAKIARAETSTDPAPINMVEAVVKSSAFKSALRSAGTVLGREITRSIFGTSRK